MARIKKTSPKPPNGFIASAVTLPTLSPATAGRKKGWQEQAWRYYDAVPELRYVSNWTGNAMSRVTLHAAKREGNELVLLDEGPAAEAMRYLYGGPQGQAQMIQQLGTDMTVSGEGYIFNRDDEWLTLATGKVHQTAKGKVTIDLPNQPGYEKSPSDLLIRIWTPHPTDANEADAPTRSNLQTLAQIIGYDDHISAQLTSRLAGAGILMLPSEMEFASTNTEDADASQASQFLSVLGETMQAAINDRQGPSAFVPIVITAPGDVIEKAMHMRFWSDLDENVIEMRESGIKRFAVGMDVPVEVLTGNGDSNHWNAWLSEESAIKIHLEPRLSVINHALTGQYLRPSLKGVVSDDELNDYFVIADTAHLRTRPNRSTDARELRGLGAISREALLRENGFDIADGMDDDQYQQWLLERIALGAVTPEMTAQAITLLGVTGISSTDTSQQEQPTSTMPPPIDDADDNEIPQLIGSALNDPLAAACEVLVWRALERAGNRLRNRKQVPGDVAVSQAYLMESADSSPDFLLEGAWDCAVEVLAEYPNIDIAAVTQTLDFYTRGLLTMKRVHSGNNLAMLLRSWGQPVSV